MSHDRPGPVDQVDVALLTSCALPGCSTLVAEAGDVCDGCRVAFGPMLVETDRPALTAEQLAERDREVVETYVEQQRLTIATASAAVASAAVASAAVASAAVASAAVAGDGEVKNNQLCWLCEQRRRCTLTAGRWECRECSAAPA